MKAQLLSFTIALLLFSTFGCTKSEQNPKPQLKGRLVLAGMCGYSTISVLEGDIDSSKIMATWTDPNTGKTYHNVFALGNPCSFPYADVKEDSEFYFTIQSDGVPDNCLRCQAIYPTPAKSLSIKVEKIVDNQ